MQIIPAIIPKNQTELITKIKQVIGLVSHIQVDVCDGKFVKTKTQFQELPHLDEIDYELDLMIEEPERVIEDYIEMQPARIVIHLESVKDFQKLFLSLERVRGIIEIGFCINNDTDKSILERYVEKCTSENSKAVFAGIDFIQIMGIAEIGSQGQPFDNRCIDHVTYFHRKYPDMPISVDGSVNNKTIRQLSDAGATRFVAGSAVFAGENIEECISALQNSVK